MAKQGANGGAVRAGRNTVFENCLFLKNGAIAGNGENSSSWQSAEGGAIYSAGGWSTSGVTTVIANCTFDSNYVEVRTNSGSPHAADVFYGYGSSQSQSMKAYIFNTIITGSYRMLGGGDNQGKAYTEDEQRKLAKEKELIRIQKENEIKLLLQQKEKEQEQEKQRILKEQEEKRLELLKEQEKKNSIKKNNKKQ